MTPRNVLTGLGWAVIGLFLWTYRTHLAALLQRDEPYDAAAVRTEWLKRERSGR